MSRPEPTYPEHIQQRADALYQAITLSAKQRLFHEACSCCSHVGFGGARGPGKSFSLCYEAVHQSLLYPGNVGVILRLNLVDLKDTTMDVMRRYVLPPLKARGLGAEWTNTVRPTLRIRVGRGGRERCSEVLWRQAKDGTGLMSANLGYMLIDEAHEVPRQTIDDVYGAVGRVVIDGETPKPLLAWASNPGPGWCKSDYPVGPVPAIRRETVESGPNGAATETRVFIPATMRDNPYLPEGYEERLRAQYRHAPHYARRMIEGDWSAFEGQVFVEFDKERHVAWGRRMDLGARGWFQIISMDWGMRNPAAALRVAIDGEGDFWVWGEHRRSGLTPAGHKPFLELLASPINGSIVWLLDPAAVDQSTGVTLRAQFHELGIPMMGYAKKKHGEDGSIAYLKYLLGANRIMLGENCPGLIEELENARWEEQSHTMSLREDPRERMVDKDDHSLDALFGALQWWRARGGKADWAGVERAEATAALAPVPAAGPTDKGRTIDQLYRELRSRWYGRRPSRPRRSWGI